MAYGATSSGLQEADVTTLINTQVGTANAATVKAALNATGSAPIYAARAFVLFDNTINTNKSGTYSRISTTVTVTMTAHGFLTGQRIYIDATSGTMADIVAVITVVDANTFTFTHGTSGTTSGNCQAVLCTMQASGNVAGVGDEGAGFARVLLSTSMPDLGYTIAPCSSMTTGSTVMLTVNEMTDATFARTTESVCVLGTYCSATVAVTWSDSNRFSLMVVR